MSYLMQGQGETITWTFDFAAKLLTGDTLTGTATVTANETVTIGTTAHDDTQVTVNVSDVPWGRVVKLTCQCATVSGETLEETGAIRGGQA